MVVSTRRSTKSALDQEDQVLSSVIKLKPPSNADNSEKPAPPLAKKRKNQSDSSHVIDRRRKKKRATSDDTPVHPKSLPPAFTTYTRVTDGAPFHSPREIKLTKEQQDVVGRRTLKVPCKEVAPPFHAPRLTTAKEQQAAADRKALKVLSEVASSHQPASINDSDHEDVEYASDLGGIMQGAGMDGGTPEYYMQSKRKVLFGKDVSGDDANSMELQRLTRDLEYKATDDVEVFVGEEKVSDAKDKKLPSEMSGMDPPEDTTMKLSDAKDKKLPSEMSEIGHYPEGTTMKKRVTFKDEDEVYDVDANNDLLSDDLRTKNKESSGEPLFTIQFPGFEFVVTQKDVSDMKGNAAGMFVPDTKVLLDAENIR